MSSPSIDFVSQIYEGHTHYVMNIALNPKDTNTFTSACLDRTVKMWSIGSPHTNFTMDAHDKEWRNIPVRRPFCVISVDRLYLSGI